MSIISLFLCITCTLTTKTPMTPSHTPDWAPMRAASFSHHYHASPIALPDGTPIHDPASPLLPHPSFHSEVLFPALPEIASSKFLMQRSLLNFKNMICGVIKFHSKTESGTIIKKIPKFEQKIKVLFSNIIKQPNANFTGLDIFSQCDDQDPSNLRIIIFVSLVSEITQISCYFEEIATMFKDTFTSNRCQPVALFLCEIQSESATITVISTWKYNSKPSDVESNDLSVDIIPINSSYTDAHLVTPMDDISDTEHNQHTTKTQVASQRKDTGIQTESADFMTRLPKPVGTTSRNGPHSKKQSLSALTSQNATFSSRSRRLSTKPEETMLCDSGVLYGLPIHIVFIMCGLTGIFCASTVSLIVVIFCCNPNNKHSKDQFLNQNNKTPTMHQLQENKSYSNNINTSNSSAMNTTQYLTPATTQDLFQQLQALQIIIQQQIANNTSLQYSNNSINDSYQNSCDECTINANNQRRMSMNSMNSVNSPWNTKIQHQLKNTFQTSNSNMSNSSNHDTDIILTGLNANQHTAVQVDTSQFMEFLDYQRRKSLQQNHVQGQGQGQGQHYQNYPNDSGIDLEVQCGTDQDYINDISSHEVLRRGSSENLFVPMPQKQVTTGINDTYPPRNSAISLPSKKKRKQNRKHYHKRNRSHFTVNGKEGGECSENSVPLPSSSEEQ